jgi:hypothetical protein
MLNTYLVCSTDQQMRTVLDALVQPVVQVAENELCVLGALTQHTIVTLKRNGFTLSKMTWVADCLAGKALNLRVFNAGVQVGEVPVQCLTRKTLCAAMRKIERTL